MKKAKPHIVETDLTDLETWLHSLVSQLRNHGLALVGRANVESSRGEKDYDDLLELARSIERVAATLGAAATRLCQKCKMVDVAFRITLGDGRPPAR